MEIKPKIGIDSLKLGMTRTQVSELWGEPSSVHDFIPLEEKPEDKWEVWSYENGIELNFQSDDDFLLGSIEVYSENALYGGVRIIGMSEKELRMKFQKVYLDDDFEENGRDYKHDQTELTFWVIYGVVDSLIISPEYDPSGNHPIWPNINN